MRKRDVAATGRATGHKHRLLLNFVKNILKMKRASSAPVDSLRFGKVI